MRTTVYIRMFLLLLFFSGFLLPQFVRAQEIAQDTTDVSKAQVLEVLENKTDYTIPGTQTKSIYQKLSVKILEGKEKDKIITLENDYIALESGQIFYLAHSTNSLEGFEGYSVFEPYRLTQIYLLFGFFLVCLIVFGGKQGIRGFFALIFSILLIFYVLFPAILKGYSPVLVSVLVSSVIVIIGSYVTHGLNKTTTSAVIGMIVTIILTGFLAHYVITSAHLSGFATEESMYLNLGTRGSIDFVALLFGGIMIGLLGVLYDVAISQAIAVEELYAVGAGLSRTEIYKRALRIGREHIGALVNTLAIAYVGVSLPLLLFFYSAIQSGEIGLTVNRELFAEEIIRTLVGSIGLIIAVPITTLVAVLILVKSRVKVERK